MNSGSSSELENDVFLPATTRASLFSSGMGFFKTKRRRNKHKNNDSKNMQELLTTIPEPDSSSYLVKNKKDLKCLIEGPIIAPNLRRNSTSETDSYESSLDSLKSKKICSEESTNLIINNSASNLENQGETCNKKSLPLNFDSISKDFTNLKYFSEYIAKDHSINRDLKDFEVGELYKFKDDNKMPFEKIYFLTPTLNYNFVSGISDENGHYKYYTNDHILYRYKPIDIIGKGSYGTVLKCVDYKYKIECALKIVKSKKQYKNCMRKEMNILYRLSEEYINYKKKGIDTHFFTQYLKSFDWRGHGIIAFKLYSKDLYHAKLGKLPFSAIKVIMIDLFSALIFLKKANVIHCDLKPENIMFIDEETYNVVVGDFGLAKINDLNKLQTDFNVQTCWYRAPEVALHIPYSYESDLWSVGVILMELIIDYPIFRAKTNTDLFYLFIKLLGDNPASMLQLNPELRNFTMMGNKRISLDKHLDKIIEELKKISNKAIEELIDGIIVWEPKKRLSLRECFDFANEI